VVTGTHRRAVPVAPAVGAALPPAGEAAAHQRLEDFTAHGLDDYETARNTLGADGTSRLSPYLRWGALHPRQVLARLGRRPAHQRLRSELGWREFYADVLFHRPRSSWANLQAQMDALPVDTGRVAEQRFEAWCQGQTGYPVVDAAARQLLGAAWVHNRARMLAASFLVKDLHLPWQWGARWYLQHLVDGDLASNNHGWQWVAGTGTDPAPFFRIFNPVLQGQKFDPDGAYVRRWVPELAGLSGSAVHEPWTAGGVPGYPDRIVDHGVERQDALARYAAVRGG
jgi:deoxyribodipyrimidine photo-lyase